MQFIDLKTQYLRVADDVRARMDAVFEHGQFILGPEVDELEKKLAEFAGVKHCVTVASATDALLIALMAMDIGPDDEVITTPFTFVATASMVKMLGAKAVFVDVDPRTYNLDPKKIAAAITPKTKVILPVNLYGQCADYSMIEKIAHDNNLLLIEDAAQSFGASQNNKRSGSFGQISITSFFPAKPLGCYGEGGACFTNDDNYAEQMRLIRHHGQRSRYNHVRLGLNGRCDTLQAAILLSKLAIFPDELEKRAAIAARYDQLLEPHIEAPYIAPGNFSAYAQYTIQVEDRDRIQKILHEQGIPTAVHYPVPLHLQPIFIDEYPNVKHLQNAENAAKKVLSLPFHPYLSQDDQDKIVNGLINALELASA
ncbi:MAG: DegT/DnrJ/EryC1/StrS family aminotransferase [Gammaproteobacteria bacterium]|nr:DegT/DnrJ/EryC1/StrS family aminotransferase [Gammaproteobacteria bacterium]